MEPSTPDSGVCDETQRSSAEPELPSIGARPSLARKRTWDSTFYSNSSDPAVFSSDDLSASADNYSRPRPKKLHKGPWWFGRSSIPSKRQPRKRSFKRNYDSGVFMGSESSDNGSEFLQDEEYASELLPPIGIASPQAHNRASFQSRPLKTLKTLTKLTEEQRTALETVQAYVDRGEEIIDLDRHALSSIPWSVLEPLQYFTRIPPSSGEFTAFEPELKLTLKNNELTTLPDKLYGLKDLVMLSIQNNHITELSPSIRHLTKLTCLNVAMNELHFIPWEVKVMMNLTLTDARILPNPLFEPVFNKQDTPEDYIFQDARGGNECKCYSRVAYLDIRGKSLDGVSPSTCAEAKPLRSCDDSLSQSNKPSGSYRDAASNVASLYEQALRSCATQSRTEDLSSYLPADSPNYLTKSLKAVHQTSHLPLCSVCSREYMVPRTEWVEWWTGLKSLESTGIPLLRRGCSWKCVPDAIVPPFARNCGWRVKD